MSRDEILALCQLIRQTAYDIHYYLGVVFLEKVYENALTHRLTKLGLKVEQQVALKVQDEDGAIIGDYFADLVVDDRIIIELKSCEKLTKIHEAQTINYLKVTGIKDALLINFGPTKFEMRKFIY